MSYLEKLFSLDGKVAIVTGAARGNGKEISFALLSAGAAVILVDRLDEVRETCQEFTSMGLDATYYILDLLDESLFRKFIDSTIREKGKVDILIYNAGVTFGHSILDYPGEMWDMTYQINLKAPYELSRLVARSMINCGGGSIINITSLNSELSFPDNPAYVTFKGALKQMTKSFALDLGVHNIRCNNIGPGYMKTDMTRGSWSNLKKRKERQERTVLNRWGEPKDLAGAVIFLSSDAASYITGQDIYIDGGWLIKGM